VPQPLSGQREYRVRNRASDLRQTGLADSCGIFCRGDDLYLHQIRSFFYSRNILPVEIGLHHAAVLYGYALVKDIPEFHEYVAFRLRDYFPTIDLLAFFVSQETTRILLRVSFP